MGFGQYSADIINAPAQRRAGQTVAQGKIDATTAATPMIGEAWQGQQDIWGQNAGQTQGALTNMQQANQDYWGQTAPKFDDSAYTGDSAIQSYLDPSMAFRMRQGVGALDASAAAQGGLYSSAHGNAVQDYAQGLASTEYGNAFDRMQTTRNNAYQQYTDFLAHQQQRRQGQMDIYGKQLGVGQQGQQNLGEARNNYDTSRIQNKMDTVNAYAEKEANRQANANLGLAAGAGLVGSGADAAVGGVAQYYGAKSGAAQGAS